MTEFYCEEEFPHSPKFCAPELLDHCYDAVVLKKSDIAINLKFCASFTFGKII